MSSGPLFDPSRSPNYGYVIPTHPSRYLRVFLEYINALSQVPCDFDRVFNCFAENLEHRILPASLNRPVLNKRLYRQYLTSILPMFSSFHITLHEVVEADNVLTVHASSKGQSISGIPYTNEYMIVVHFVLSGSAPHPHMNRGPPKMWLVKEFVDSSFSLKFFADERERKREREAAAAERAKKEQEDQAKAISQGRHGGW